MGQSNEEREIKRQGRISCCRGEGRGVATGSVEGAEPDWGGGA